MKTTGAVSAVHCWVPLAVLAFAAVARADAPAVRAGSYALETQMILPHLEEMRRISKHERACIDDGEAARFFPVLRQPAMTGYILEPGPTDGPTQEYLLRCDPINGASGRARLTFAEKRVTGVLEAKMGGKNMTFSQRVEARLLGGCRSR